MSIFYAMIGILAAIQASLISFGIIESGAISITWVRIHFVTIGIVTQAIFGILPYIISGELSNRWDIWAFLNSGFFLFFFGRSILDTLMMITGGSLIFIATSLFLIQLFQLNNNGSNYLFYVFGIIFFLFGITIGTGIWADWADILRIANPLESHIHAQNWGFINLVYTGLILDLYTKFTGKKIANPGAIKYILILQTLGGFLLLLSPWLGGKYAVSIMIVGMIAFLVGTTILLRNILLPLRGERKDWGFLHLIAGYVWIYAPLVFSPFIILGVDTFRYVEQNAPQSLIYGWVFQTIIAFLPYFLGSEQKLGGTKLSLILVNLGGIFLWLNIFIREFYEILFGIAYALWAMALILTFYQSTIRSQV